MRDSRTNPLYIFCQRCLKKFGYFGPDRTDISPEGDNLTEDELYIGYLLNHFLESLQFNSHEVAQVKKAK